MEISEDTVGEVESINYVGSFIQKNGGFDDDVKHKIGY